MTIAACYLSSEGVVFGADSTTTMFVQGPGPNPIGADHHYNFAQKIFQIGDDDQSTLAITMWGLGSLGELSYRTLIAEFSDDLVARPVGTMADVADRWNNTYWSAYSRQFGSIIAKARVLVGQGTRTPDEETELSFLQQNFSGGFCLGGYRLPNRKPEAYEVVYQPSQAGPQAPQPLAIGTAKFWGCPNIMHRLLYGVDFGMLAAIESSPHWTGTQDDLVHLASPYLYCNRFLVTLLAGPYILTCVEDTHAVGS